MLLLEESISQKPISSSSYLHPRTMILTSTELGELLELVKVGNVLPFILIRELTGLTKSRDRPILSLRSMESHNRLKWWKGRLHQYQSYSNLSLQKSLNTTQPLSKISSKRYHQKKPSKEHMLFCVDRLPSWRSALFSQAEKEWLPTGLNQKDT